MLTDNHKITSLKYDDAISRLMEGKSIDVDEARRVISSMSFKDYHRLLEASADIVPPSGRPISPQAPQQAGSTAPAAGQAIPTPKPPGAPIQPGDANSPPVPGSQIQGVAQQLAPAGSKVPVIPGHPQQTEEGAMLQRLRELAGIGEDCSGGATGAGAIAMAPSSMGKVRRREVDEAPPKEYVRTAPPKTIVGDTKPNQASGELSATLAARKLKTATRQNNGIR